MAMSRILFELPETSHPLSEPGPAVSPAGGAGAWEQKQEPAEYYRAAAARARALEQDATTPRVKQHLRELIDRYDRLAGEIERTAEAEPGANTARLR